MCNLSWTPHSNLEKDNSLNHSCVSPKMDCLAYTVVPATAGPCCYGHLLQPDTFTMYQLLCHVNVSAPADTCLTRTADRAILDFVPVMKWTVVITIKYYDNFKEFGTIPVRDRYRYQVIHIIYNFQPGIDGKRTRKRWLLLTQRTLGELGRVRNRRRANHFILLLYLIL